MGQKTMGQRIREERKKLGFTQEQLAEEVHLTPAYIGQIERGERSLTLDNLIAIAKSLGVTVDYLLSDAVTPKDDRYTDLWRQLTHGKSDREKELAINMVKLMFGYLDTASGKGPAGK